MSDGMRCGLWWAGHLRLDATERTESRQAHGGGGEICAGVAAQEYP